MIKNKKNLTLIISVFLFATIMLSACGNDAANGTETPYIQVLDQTATNDVSIYMTQAAGTVFAQFTETALAVPTNTPTATETATPTLTSTPLPTATTYYVWVAPTTSYYTSTPLSLTPSLTPTTAAYSCSITSKSIADGTDFSPNEDFDASWTVKNTGSETWDASNFDFRYISGTSMYKHNAVYDFPSSVAPGESITITVDMVAPSSAAYYETFWGINYSSTTICSLPLRIDVVD